MVLGSVCFELGPYSFYAGSIDVEILPSDATGRAKVDNTGGPVQRKLHIVGELQPLGRALAINIVRLLGHDHKSLGLSKNVNQAGEGLVSISAKFERLYVGILLLHMCWV